METALELRNHKLFSGIQSDTLLRQLERTPVSRRTFDTGNVVMLQGERLHAVSIIMEGKLSATIQDQAGRSLLVETLVASEILAPSMLFAEHAYIPVTLTAAQDGSIISIEMDPFRKLARGFPEIYERLLQQVGEKFDFITTRMRFLHFATLREKFAGYLLERCTITGTSAIKLPYDRTRLSELFGVARPSLSRTIGKLVNEGTIVTSGRSVEIVDTGALKQAARGESE